METELTNKLIPKEKKKKTKRPLEEYSFSNSQRAAFAYEQAWKRLPGLHKVMMVSTLMLILLGNGFCHRHRPQSGHTAIGWSGCVQSSVGGDSENRG